MVWALSTGHRGGFSTCHAGDAPDALARLETMCLLGDGAVPHRAVRAQVLAAVDVLVGVARAADGQRRITGAAPRRTAPGWARTCSRGCGEQVRPGRAATCAPARCTAALGGVDLGEVGPLRRHAARRRSMRQRRHSMSPRARRWSGWSGRSDAACRWSRRWPPGRARSGSRPWTCWSRPSGWVTAAAATSPSPSTRSRGVAAGPDRGRRRGPSPGQPGPILGRGAGGTAAVRCGLLLPARPCGGRHAARPHRSAGRASWSACSWTSPVHGSCAGWSTERCDDRLGAGPGGGLGGGAHVRDRPDAGRGASPSWNRSGEGCTAAHRLLSGRRRRSTRPRPSHRPRGRRAPWPGPRARACCRSGSGDRDRPAPGRRPPPATRSTPVWQRWDGWAPVRCAPDWPRSTAPSPGAGPSRMRWATCPTGLGPPVRPLVTTLTASLRSGAPPGPSLQRLADAQRQRQRRRAEERVRRLPVLLLAPLVGLVMPAFVVLTIVPVAVTTARAGLVPASARGPVQPVPVEPP